MFVRRKKNRSGTTIVVVVSKSRGTFREVKNFGTAQSEEDVETLCESARRWIHTYGGQLRAHVCICFVAYKVYKELERIIKLSGIDMSVEKVLDIAKTITTIRINLPHNQSVYTQTLFLTEKQKSIKPLFEDSHF